MSDKPHTPSVLLRYPLKRKQGGPQSRAERFAEKKTLAPAGIPTELSRLLKEKFTQL
jgi:hypothetical protein